MENPCLTNQINCFRALFSREEYRSLFSDAGVRRKLGERILTCKNFGSHMLDFFETYLADDDPDSILKQKEWRRLRKAAAATAQKDISITAGPEEIDEHVFDNYLDTAGIPDPDLMIRTSGELRLSNFLLWQMAYTEFYFTDVAWPDFNKAELVKAIEKYNQRDRRDGGVKEE